ncbi:MAG: hypothetical protein ABSG16_05530 [Candidatus Acidiferrum sp.]
MGFAYSAFGLRIHSNVPFPGVPLLDSSAVASDSSCAVRFHLNLAPYPDAARSHREKELAYVSSYTDEAGLPVLRIWKAADESFLRLDYRDGTQLWIDHSRRNVFAVWPENLTLQNTLTYLLGPVFGLLLRLRGVTCLHASAVAFGDSSVVFVGSEGAGKSTTAAAFAKRGYAVLSDDIAALGSGGATPSVARTEHASRDSRPPAERQNPFLVLPAYPHICLWPEAAKFLYGSEEQFPRLAPEWNKRKLSLGAGGTRFETRPLPLAAIYLFADRAAEHAPRVEGAPRKAALLALLANTYANNLLDAAMRAEEFAVLDRLVACIPVRLLTPHKDPAFIEQLCNVICGDLTSLRRA